MQVFLTQINLFLIIYKYNNKKIEKCNLILRGVNLKILPTFFFSCQKEQYSLGFFLEIFFIF